MGSLFGKSMTPDCTMPEEIPALLAPTASPR
jgi:hypothetical protein